MAKSPSFNLTIPVPFKYVGDLNLPGMLEMDSKVQLEGVAPVVLETVLPIAVRTGLTVITSAREGTHSKDSRHYLGMALDFRVKHLPKAERLAKCTELQEALGSNWKVLLSSHLHVQYQGYPIPSGR